MIWDTLGIEAMPNINAIIADGAVAATTVRTLANHPSTVEGYATLGAGTRVRADERAADAVDTTGPGEPGQVVVKGAAATVRRNAGRHLSSLPGALGQALHSAGLRTAVVGNADTSPSAPGSARRPAPVALMDASGVVDTGRVGTELLMEDAAAPTGWRADPAAVRREVGVALAGADVVLVDPGDTDRAATGPPEARRRALAATDGLIGDVAAMAGPDALFLVVSVAPPGEDWHLTPMVASGRGVTRGHLHSPSTRRPGLVTLTDVGPTVLQSLGAKVPYGMIGHSLRYRAGEPTLGALRDLDRDAAFREALYFKVTITYIVLLAVVYLLAILAFWLRRIAKIGPLLRLVVLAFSA